MTPRALAEKIVTCLNGKCDCTMHGGTIDQIESLLSEALASMYNADCEKLGQHQACDHIIEQLSSARAAAFEEGLKDGRKDLETHIKETLANLTEIKRQRDHVYEECAKIVETEVDLSQTPEFVFHSNACKGLAKQIRLRAGELK